MRCIYKVLFTSVHPGAEKVNAWGKCSPRCSPLKSSSLPSVKMVKLSDIISSSYANSLENTSADLPV